MSVNQQPNSTSSQKIWSFDIILCCTLLFLGSYNFTDVFIRTLLGNNLFQFNWIFISIAFLRLIDIFLEKNSIDKRFFKTALTALIPLLFVIVYTFIVTLYQIDFLREHNLYFGSVSNKFIFNRAIKYLLYSILAIYFASVINNWKKLYITLLSLLTSLCILEVLGIIQEIIFLVTTIDIFPIIRTRVTGLLYQSATVTFSGIKLLRIKSLAHEPKGLASLMYILFIFKFYSSSFLKHAQTQVRIPKFFTAYLQKTWFITILVILLTFSGSGLLGFSFIFAVILLTNFMPSFSSLQGSNNTKIILFILFTSFIVFFQFQEQFLNFLDVSILRRASTFFEDRTLESLYSGSTDPEDAAAIINIIKFPQIFTTGIGFGGYSNLALPIVASIYRGLTIETVSPFSRNILIEILFSSGIIGIISVLFLARNLFRKFTFHTNIIMPFILVIVSSFLIRSYEVLFFISIGLLCAINTIISDNSN